MHHAGVLGPVVALLAMAAQAAAIRSSLLSRRQNATLAQPISTGANSTSAGACSLIPGDDSWMTSQGIMKPANAATVGSGPGIALSSDGPFTITFTNSASQDLIGIIWAFVDGSSSFVKAVAPAVAFSLAQGASCSVSVASGTKGAWSSIYGHDEKWVAESGYVFNTWGEFNAGETVEGSVMDVSYEPNTKGHEMSISVSSQCTSDKDRCSFHCKDTSQPSCYEAGSYTLLNCEAGSQANAQIGYLAGSTDQPEGGCSGWSITKNAVATFLD